METKKCPDCQQAKPLAEFHRNRSMKDGRAGYCKPCWRKRDSAYYEKRAAERPPPPPAGLRQCSKCDQVKPFTEFHRHRGFKGGYAKRCKKCASEYQRAYYSDPAKRAHHATQVREGHYRRRYGITIGDYDRMLAEQGGACAICHRPPKPTKGRAAVLLAVDHCHKTGEVRGLLCSPCNRLLHKLETDDAWMQKAVAYLT